jgi:hypothetical protein
MNPFDVDYFWGIDLGLLATSSRCTSKAQACQVEATSIGVVKQVWVLNGIYELKILYESDL